MTEQFDETVGSWAPETALDDKIRALLTSNSNYIHAFIQIIRYLKTRKRTGWIDRGIPIDKVESIADHMYRMGILAMIVPNKQVNTDKCVKIALVHDIAESLVGDIPPYANVTKAEKHRREYETVKYLSTLLKPYNPDFAHEIVELWLDYEEIRTIEARYVKDIDKLEMIQQAWEYEQEYGLQYNLDEFYLSRPAIKTPEIGQLCDDLVATRTAWKAEQQSKQQ
ncbi:5'-deoxynucleotidase Ygk1p [Diutina catenulata]